MTSDRLLQSIPAFLAVLDTGSIQGAARELNVARPTIRRRLDELETEIGVPLQSRDTGGIRPTAAGLVFATRAREMMGELDELGRAAREAGASPRGVLRVGMPLATPPEILAGMTDAVRSMWPEVRLELIVGTTNDDLIGRVDCRFGLELREPVGPFVSIDLGVVNECLIASDAYLERQPVETLADLEGHEIYAWVAADRGPVAELPLRTAGALPVKVIMATNDLQALLWVAREGRGLVYMPFEKILARPAAFGTPNLRVVLEDEVGTVRPRRLIVARALMQMPVVAAFVEQTRVMASVLLAET